MNIFTIIERIVDAGTDTRVTLIRGRGDILDIMGEVWDQYENKIGTVLKGLGIPDNDPTISEGAQVNGKWLDAATTSDLWGQDWLTGGYVEWKYRNGNDEVTITVYPPDHSPTEIIVP